jgi:predicted metalloendopeptidase
MASLRPPLAIIFLLPVLLAAPPQAHGLSLSSLDRRVAPGDDFFTYANGAWLDSSMPGVMGLLWNLTNERVAALIQAAAASKAPVGSDRRKLGDCYSSLLDEAATEAKGLKPLRPTLQAIAAIRDRQALARQLGATLSTKAS